MKEDLIKSVFAMFHPKRERRYGFPLRSRPTGNRIFQEVVGETEKALRLRYYDWLLWIPRRAITRTSEGFTAPLWAVESAKEHSSARIYENIETVD